MAKFDAQSTLKRLQNRYRLVVMNDDTYEEVVTFKLSRLSVYITLSTIFVLLTGLTVALIVFTPLRMYIPGYGDVNTMREFSRMDPLRVWYSNISVEDIIEVVPKAVQKRIRKRIKKVMSGTGSELDFPKLAGSIAGQIRITDQPPLIFHPEDVHAPETWAEIEKVLHAYRETLAEAQRMLLDRYRLVDVAIKVVGVGSVGRLCSIVLLMSESNDPLFLQCKEAGESVLEPYAGKSVYKHHGQRVVMHDRAAT